MKQIRHKQKVRGGGDSGDSSSSSALRIIAVLSAPYLRAGAIIR